jgi:hypothetical protein
MGIHTLHDLFIALHAASGALSFLAGSVLIFSARNLANPLFGAYWWFLAGLIVFLTGAMVAYWRQYAAAERIIFSGLFVLGLYMLYRARSASRLLQDQPAGWKRSYVAHVGFTLISLLEGFIIVAASNTGGAAWLTTLFGALGFLLGRWALGLAEGKVEVDEMAATAQ